ncbi:MAG TPA: hypothetical protein VI385_07890 [Flavisolibacter sp.]
MLMSEDKTTIRFRDLYQLWQFAQAIKSTSMEIRTNELLLICDCSREDLRLVAKFGGTVIHTEALIH